MKEQRCAICGMLDFFDEPIDWSKIKEKDLGGFPSEENGLSLEHIAMRCKKCGYTSFDITKNLLKDTEILKDEEYLKILSDDTLGSGKNLFMLGYLLEKQESFLSSAMAYNYLSFLFEKEGNPRGMREGRKRSIFSFLKHIGTDTFKKNPSMVVYQHFIDALRRQKMFDKAIIFCDIALNLAQTQKMRKIFLLEKSLCLNYIDSSHSYDFEEEDSILNIINNLTDFTKQSNEKDLKALRSYMDEAILYPLTRGADLILKVGKDIKYSDFAEKVKVLYLKELSKDTKKSSEREKSLEESKKNESHRENSQPETKKEDLSEEFLKLKKEKEWLREEISQLEQEKSDFDVEMTFFESEKEALRVMKDNLELKDELLQKKENRLTDMETGLSKLQEDLTKERILLEEKGKELANQFKNIPLKEEEEIKDPQGFLNLDSFGIYDQLKQGLTFSKEPKKEIENRNTESFHEKNSSSPKEAFEEPPKDNVNLSREITKTFKSLKQNLLDQENEIDAFSGGYAFGSEPNFHEEEPLSKDQQLDSNPFEEETLFKDKENERGDMSQEEKDLEFLHQSADAFSDSSDLEELFDQDIISLFRQKVKENEEAYKNEDLSYENDPSSYENEEAYKNENSSDENDHSESDESDYNEETIDIEQPNYNYGILEEKEPSPENELDELKESNYTEEISGNQESGNFTVFPVISTESSDEISENAERSNGELVEDSEGTAPPNVSFFDDETLQRKSDEENKFESESAEPELDTLEPETESDQPELDALETELAEPEFDALETESNQLDPNTLENETSSPKDDTELFDEIVESEERSENPHPFENVMEDFYREKGETLEEPSLSPHISFEELDDLNWKEEVLEIIQKEKKITIGEVQMLFGLGYKEAKDILEELLSEGYLKKDGDSYDYKEENQ